MKSTIAHLTSFLKPTTRRRNVQLLLKFLAVLAVMVVVYSVLFHLLMQLEGQKHSWLTGFYWTLTVMSTLGFGDITFTSDIGRLFSIVVLISGMVFLLMLLPFTLLEFFYAPWMQAQSEMRAPRRLPPDTEGHIILTHYDPVAAALIAKVTHYGYSYVLLVPDLTEALRLHDLGLRVVFGEIDRPETYADIRADKALLVALTGTDESSTNLAFTIREMAPSVPIVSIADSPDSVDILELAGSSHVIHLPQMMGQALARRITGVDARSHVIGNFEDLLIAEASPAGTPLVGKTLMESGIRSKTGVTVIGLWLRGRFVMATAQTQIDTDSMLVLAGTADQLRAYDELFCIYHVSGEPVIVIGGGRVGSATAKTLAERDVDYRMIEIDPKRVTEDERHILGSAADLATLKRAGIDKTPAIVITTRDDDISIYLTIYCRRLRPDVQIIGRATRERNVSTLHRAGADFVLSYASMGATAVFNYLKNANILLLAEGLQATETEVPASLAGKTLSEAAIPQHTACTVVALRTAQGTRVNPSPETRLEAGAVLILICTPKGEQQFLQRYGARKVAFKLLSPPVQPASPPE